MCNTTAITKFIRANTGLYAIAINTSIWIPYSWYLWYKYWRFFINYFVFSLFILNILKLRNQTVTKNFLNNLTCVNKIVRCLKAFSIKDIVRHKSDMKEASVWRDGTGFICTTVASIKSITILKIWKLNVVTFGLRQTPLNHQIIIKIF